MIAALIVSSFPLQSPFILPPLASLLSTYANMDRWLTSFPINISETADHLTKRNKEEKKEGGKTSVGITNKSRDPHVLGESGRWWEGRGGG